MLVDGDRNWDLFYLGEHDPHISRFLKRTVRQGDMVLDIGARFGEFTIPLALAVGPSGHVYALEALQANHELLERNIALEWLDERYCSPRRCGRPHSADRGTGAQHRGELFPRFEEPGLYHRVRLVSG